MNYTMYGIGRPIHVNTDRKKSLEMIWRSQMCWFSPGTKAIVVDEDGNSETFIKEADN